MLGVESKRRRSNEWYPVMGGAVAQMVKRVVVPLPALGPMRRRWQHHRLPPWLAGQSDELMAHERPFVRDRRAKVIRLLFRLLALSRGRHGSSYP